MPPNPPKRRIQLKIEISADSWEDVADAIKLLQRYSQNPSNPNKSGLSRGINWDHELESTENPEMTGEKYKILMNEWCVMMDKL